MSCVITMGPDPHVSVIPASTVLFLDSGFWSAPLQVKYVVELARAIASHPAVHRVELLTRLVQDPKVSIQASSGPLTSCEPVWDPRRLSKQGGRILASGAGWLHAGCR